MKNIKALSVLIALLVSFSAFAGCGKKAEYDETDYTDVDVEVETNETEEEIEEVEEPEEVEEVEEVEESEESDDSDSVVSYSDRVEKISTLKSGEITSHGVIYNENKKYGILALDGKNDTGAKYASCEVEGDVFVVTTAEVTSIDDVALINCYGAVDAYGKEIIPMEYATIKKLNDRYYKCIEAQELTDNKDEAIMYYTSNIFSLTAGDEDTLIKGRWYIYDVVEGKLLDGVSATNAYIIDAYGDFLEYVSDDDETITVDKNGKQLDEDAHVYQNGYYSIEVDDVYNIYDSDHNLAFTLSSDDYSISTTYDDLFIVRYYENDDRSYFLIDTEGNKISAGFEDYPNIYGKFVFVNEKLYTFDGKEVVEGTFERVYYDDEFGRGACLENGEKYTFIDSEGNVLYQGKNTDNLVIDPYYFSIKENDKYYNFAEKEFSFTGNDLYEWIVMTNDDDKYELVDTYTGEKLISGYTSYRIEKNGSDMYIFAYNNYEIVDVYLMK